MKNWELICNAKTKREAQEIGLRFMAEQLLLGVDKTAFLDWIEKDTITNEQQLERLFVTIVNGCKKYPECAKLLNDYLTEE